MIAPGLQRFRKYVHPIPRRYSAIRKKYSVSFSHKKAFFIPNSYQLLTPGLQLRLECLVQPLNTLLLWSIDKDSTIQPVIINALQTVQNVCEFIANIEKERGEFTQENSDYLEFYLREMDFACQSVSMALSLVTATRNKEVEPGLALTSGTGCLPLGGVGYGGNMGGGGVIPPS